MSIEEISEKFDGKMPLIIGGAVITALLFASFSKKQNSSETVIAPVTEGTSYPTVSENADVILSNISNLIESTKKELSSDIEGVGSSINSKVESLQNDFTDSFDILKNDVDNIHVEIEKNQAETINKFEAISTEINSQNENLKHHFNDVIETVTNRNSGGGVKNKGDILGTVTNKKPLSNPFKF